MNVPRTILKPGKASTNIFVVGLDNIPSDNLHLFKTLTKIKGDMNLKINVKIANGQRRWGDVDAK